MYFTALQVASHIGSNSGKEICIYFFCFLILVLTRNQGKQKWKLVTGKVVQEEVRLKLYLYINIFVVGALLS